MKKCSERLNLSATLWYRKKNTNIVIVEHEQQKVLRNKKFEIGGPKVVFFLNWRAQGSIFLYVLKLLLLVFVLL